MNGFIDGTVGHTSVLNKWKSLYLCLLSLMNIWLMNIQTALQYSVSFCTASISSEIAFSSSICYGEKLQ